MRQLKLTSIACQVTGGLKPEVAHAKLHVVAIRQYISFPVLRIPPRLGSPKTSQITTNVQITYLYRIRLEFWPASIDRLISCSLRGGVIFILPRRHTERSCSVGYEKTWSNILSYLPLHKRDWWRLFSLLIQRLALLSPCDPLTYSARRSLPRIWDR